MTDTKLRTREVQQMDRKLVFARMYFDSTMENVSAGEVRASEMEVEKGFSDYLELMTYMATLNGDLVPDFEKASEAISAIEQAKCSLIFPGMPAGAPSTPHMRNFRSQLCSNVIAMPDFHLELEEKYSKSEAIFTCKN